MTALADIINGADVERALENPTGWRGTLDGRPVFFEKDLFDQGGFKIALHRFVGADDPGCFHSHPAMAIRAILSGGYVEELPDGTKQTLLPGYTGLVHPDLAHRVHSLLDGPSVSLWIRMPKTHEINLVGDGWPNNTDMTSVKKAADGPADPKAVFVPKEEG